MEASGSMEELGLPLLAGSEGQQLQEVASTGSSYRQTVFNMVNLFLGIGLLSMPFALKKGGWLALVPLCLTTSLFCLSAHLIILAFDRLPPSVQRTYPELGGHAAGKAGRRLVVMLALIELFGSSCIVLLVIWQQIALLLPSGGLWGHSPLHMAVAAASCTLAPTLLLRNFKSLSSLSMLGFSSSVLVVAVVLSLLPLDPYRTGMPQQPPPGHTLARVGMLQSIGIFAVSVSGHSSLPSLRAAMRRPSQFPRVLTLTFSIMLVAYASLAASGYFYFGDAAAPLVTVSIAADSVLSGRALLGVLTADRLLASLILVSCLTKYPILVMVQQDMLFSLLPSSSPGTPRGTIRLPRHGFAYALRLLVFVLGAGISYSTYTFLGCIISLVGGMCSITTSLILPTTFYTMLAWKDLSRASKGGLGVLLLGAAALVCSITTQNVLDILSHLQERPGPAEGGGALMGVAQALIGVATR